jgi:hypothetical protein
MRCRHVLAHGSTAESFTQEVIVSVEEWLGRDSNIATGSISASRIVHDGVGKTRRHLAIVLITELETFGNRPLTQLRANPTCNLPDSIAAVAQPNGETLLREWEGLPPDAIFLAPPFRPVPMRTPAHAWALRVNLVDMAGDRDLAGAVDVFAGSWTAKTPASGAYDGDLVVRLMAPDHSTWRG